MFQIEKQPLGKITQYHLKNGVTGEFISILPSFGGVINQICLAKNGQLHELLDGCSTYEELISEGRNKYKGSKLFPFPNRIKDGQYIFENKVYNFPINFPNEKNAIHGSVLENKFDIVAQVASEFETSLSIACTSSGKEEGYPFKTTIVIKYSLDKDGFSCSTTIENKENKKIPVGDGWHPYFKTGSKIDTCFLTLPVACSYKVDSRMIPTGEFSEELVYSKSTRIGTTQFDTGYKLAKSANKRMITKLEDPTLDLSLNIWQDGGEGNYNYLQVYIPPDRQSIALEPMTCLADAFNNKEGLIVLLPSEKRNFSFGLKLE